MKEVLYKIKKDSSITFKDHLIISRQKDNFLGNCLHPRFSFKCSIKIFNFENYFLAFNTSYRELNKMIKSNILKKYLLAKRYGVF